MCACIGSHPHAHPLEVDSAEELNNISSWLEGEREKGSVGEGWVWTNFRRWNETRAKKENQTHFEEGKPKTRVFFLKSPLKWAKDKFKKVKNTFKNAGKKVS